MNVRTLPRDAYIWACQFETGRGWYGLKPEYHRETIPAPIEEARRIARVICVVVAPAYVAYRYELLPDVDPWPTVVVGVFHITALWWLLPALMRRATDPISPEEPPCRRSPLTSPARNVT